MNKTLSHFVLLLTCMNFSEITFTATVDSLSRTTPGQAALELSRMHPVTAATLISQMNAGIAARVVSPDVMTSEIAAKILNQASFESVARILAPTVTASANANFILAEMVRQAPRKVIQGGVMHGMDAGTAAAYLAKNRSNAAQLLYSMNAGTAVHILAPTVMMPSDAKNILSEVVALSPSLATSSSTYRNSGAEGGEYGHGGHGSHHAGQIAGVSAGSFGRGLFHITDVLFEAFHATDTHCAPGEHCASDAYCPSGGCINNEVHDAFSALDALDAK